MSKHRFRVNAMAATMGQNRSILVVDDNPLQRSLVSQALETIDFVISEAEDGETGLAAIERARPDLVILDVMMPGIDGFEVCKRIRDTAPIRHLPILMMTALHDTASIEKAFEVGATNFMTKPVHRHLLSHQINYMLRTSDQEEALREAKAVAESANKMKTRFLANMSHELRTPLNAIMGFAELLKTQVLGPLGDPKYVEYASDMYDSGRHLLEIVNAVLDLSKIEAGFMTLHETDVDVVKLIEHVIRYLEPMAEDAGIELGTNLAPGIPRISADKTKLRQILLNLLSNAIKFTPKGGTVTVEAELTETGDIHLAIADTGIGIDKKNLPKVFEAFVQVDDDLDRGYEGTGLGVPLALAFTRLHDGTLNIESALGKGTTVSVVLPTNRTNTPVETAASD